jgi:hypothetical protein
VSLDTLYAPIAADMQAVDAVIRARLHSDVVLIRQVAEYIIGAGGKRLRPALVLYSAGALGYRGNHHQELAAVVEFIHTATLLHDDVVDESDLRRGNKTANALFGNAASVLVGDFLYSRAFQMMVSVGSMRVQQVLADATNTIAEGEVLQLLNCHNADVEVAQYLQVIRFKTAKLFEAAARLGAILAAPRRRSRRAGPLRHAPGHRLPDRRRRARLFRRRGGHRQAPRRRSGRGQADAAADPCHEAPAVRRRRLRAARHRGGRPRGIPGRPRCHPRHRRAG